MMSMLFKMLKNGKDLVDIWNNCEEVVLNIRGIYYISSELSLPV